MDSWHNARMTPAAADLIAQFDEFIRRDPARRGLISSEPQFGPLCPGHLAAAAAHLAEHGKHVAIVTGFYIPKGDPPAAETDGPLGSALLAAALHAAGMKVELITDELCSNAVRVAAWESGLNERCMHVVKMGAAADFAREFGAQIGNELTHLIAIERVGPSHTEQSLRRQSRTGDPPSDRFASLVPLEHQDHCHNMRGEIIDGYTADLHLLFESLPNFRFSVGTSFRDAVLCERRGDGPTIGIGDGGNEIGMGCVPWEDLERRLSGEQSGRVPCCVATDWNIVAGVSNWGAYALAAATLLLRGQQLLLAPFDTAQQQRALEHLVAHGPAVDGVTRRREPTVDGLPFLTYIQPWQGMRRLLGLPD